MSEPENMFVLHLTVEEFKAVRPILKRFARWRDLLLEKQGVRA